MISVNINNYEKLKNSEKSLIYITTRWCGPCKMLAPLIEEVSNEKKDIINIGKIDAEEDRELVSSLNVKSVPTLIFFKNGSEVSRHIGIIQKNDLLEKISNM